MSADLIDFASRLAARAQAVEHEVGERIKSAYPDLSSEACCMLASQRERACSSPRRT
jgi:hypothetical protein